MAGGTPHTEQAQADRDVALHADSDHHRRDDRNEQRRRLRESGRDPDAIVTKKAC